MGVRYRHVPPTLVKLGHSSAASARSSLLLLFDRLDEVGGVVAHELRSPRLVQPHIRDLSTSNSAAWRGRVEAVLDQPAGRHQASPRPPRADHVEVDVGAVAGDDVAKVLLVSERQDGEVVQGIALGLPRTSRSRR